MAMGQTFLVLALASLFSGYFTLLFFDGPGPLEHPPARRAAYESVRKSPSHYVRNHGPLPPPPASAATQQRHGRSGFLPVLLQRCCISSSCGSDLLLSAARVPVHRLELPASLPCAASS